MSFGRRCSGFGESGMDKLLGAPDMALPFQCWRHQHTPPGLTPPYRAGSTTTQWRTPHPPSQPRKRWLLATANLARFTKPVLPASVDDPRVILGLDLERVSTKSPVREVTAAHQAKFSSTSSALWS